MEPTEQELKWTAAIKEAAMEDDRINDGTLCDWEYLQHALVAKDKVDDAIRRIQKMQAFKQRYCIRLDGSVEEAARDFKAYELQHAGFMVTVAHREQDDSLVFCFDYARMMARRMKTPESVAVMMRTFFYLLQACQHSVQAMRSGFSCLNKSQGIGWKNVTWQVEELQVDFLSRAYPVRVQDIIRMCYWS